jgi:hypothetical protein
VCFVCVCELCVCVVCMWVSLCGRVELVHCRVTEKMVSSRAVSPDECCLRWCRL